MIRSLARRWADTALRRENERLTERVAMVQRIAKLLAVKLAASRSEVRRLTAELDAMKEKT